MEHQALHPNLARLVVTHADIVSRYHQELLSHADALTEIKNLVARDDTGILWAIDATGNWMRYTVAGDCVIDTPPTYGLATPTAFDVSTPTGNAVHTDSFARMAVEDEALWSADRPGAGATRDAGQRPVELVHAPADRIGALLLAVTAVIVVLGVLLFVL